MTESLDPRRSSDAEPTIDQDATGPTTDSPEDTKPPVPRFISDPDRIDALIFLWLMANMAIGLIALPLRVWLVNHPEIYALLIGGRTSAVIGGAQSTMGGTAAWIIVALTPIGFMRTPLLWWVIGRRWGREYVDMVSNSTPSMAKWIRRLDKVKPRTLMILVALAHIPFIPGAILTVGNLLAGVRRVRFTAILVINLVCLLVVNGLFAYLGTQYGEVVIDIVEQINRYALWITIALIAFAILSARWQKRRGGSLRRR